MPPKKDHNLELIQKINSFENTVTQNNAMIVSLKDSFTQIQDMLRTHADGMEVIQRHFAENESATSSNTNEQAGTRRKKIPMPMVTMNNGNSRKRKILKLDVLDAILQLKPDIEDFGMVYENIRSCAYYRIKSLMDVTYNNHPPPWRDVLPCYRRKIVNLLNERVLGMDVDLSLCEDDWVALHLIKRSYQNREKYMRYY
ncbi:uncharacterized protein EV154DRAFT_532771 [Mucor mucedo]|uniref:uncharacterized protein n=1 Tax=Mucor mucedo TaxID=29922 RepID=UPI002220D493|nr:uncharacterized protein EV154DRAFT_532771 [Mucor mucedo]KAI7866210.1 hypothetical protein EV154DRAFT_532771 [Mucor mucedo]